jgi:hypothetical protein
MKRLCFLISTALMATSCGSPNTESNAPVAGGNGAPGGAGSTAGSGDWQVLFDGSSLDRWNAVGDANWSIDGDTVRADASTVGSFLVSDVDYTDFDLSLEFWVSGDANSGVFIRCMNPDVIDADTCYEVNIFDTRPDPAYRTGAIVNLVSPAAMINTGGRWNSYEISAHGRRLRATLNDIEMYDVEDGKLASGPIALQYGSGIVIFRNVRVRTP